MRLRNLALCVLTLGCGVALGAAVAAGAVPKRSRLAAHYAKLQKRVPRDFHARYERPFYVVGNVSPGKLRLYSERLIRWTVKQLQQAYFAKDPQQIIDVWLFKDRKSYRHYAWILFRHRPSTPYGYYSPQHRALIMNIGTGGGTLVHEIVHPYIEANFPNCPSWFNEGLGSLYEASADRGGKIVGLLNWRLPGLKQAIQARRLPSLRYLTSRTTSQFYQADPGSNYAHARYLLYYLLQKKLLRRYYRAFRAARKSDPTGYRTLLKVLKIKRVGVFEKRFRGWALSLKRS